MAKQTKIIGISGKQFAGKDALADLILAAKPNYQKLPIALAIKQAYAQQNDLTLPALEANKAQHRPGLIELGNWGRAQDADYWLKQVLNHPKPIIISDVRMKREYDLLKERGAFLIRLNADRDVRAERGTLVSETDPTECELDDITDWDAILTNNSNLAALKTQVDALLPRLP